MYDIPILFIIFRRKHTALRSFQRIRAIKPQKLYIACDAPRPSISKEVEQVEETRNAILSAIDWECDLHTRFLDENLGCSLGVYTAINWLFDHEEKGIILEDDCVVQLSFFPFMETLLEKYKNDQRIGMIDGANYIKNISLPYSYVFSKYKSTNGWATWKRAWCNMQIDMNWRNTADEASVIANTGYNGKDKKYWRYRIKLIDYKDVSAWDWQWYFTLASQNQLSIFPKVSLVTNIGFGEGATHTTNKHVPQAYIAHDELDFPLSHPKYVMPYEPFDKAFYHSNNSLYNNLMKYLPISIKKFLKKTFKL